MFTRHSLINRRIVLTSVVVGLLIALAAGLAQYSIFHHRRAAQFDNTISSLQSYLDNYFNQILVTIDSLQPLTMDSCQAVSSELTARAAFSMNVRAFLLVKDNIAYCSSATGPMSLGLKELVPDLDLTKSHVMGIVSGTPMMPTTPAFVLWVKSPLLENRGIFASINANLMPWVLYSSKQSPYNGVALVVNGKTAISTFSSKPLTLDQIPDTAVRHVKIKGVPLEVYLYSNALGTDNSLYSLLLGLTCGLLGGLLCLYILAIRSRPGKEILAAIKHRQFYVVYQPVVDAKNRQITGVEALMRWSHPTVGNIPPDAFISYAEAQDLIVPLTHHLFELIARDAPMLKDLLPPGAKLGINIAPSHLHAESFQHDIRQLAASLPDNYFQVVLEITERDMLNQERAMNLFAWLRGEGIEIAIDDFGTGHSALIYLERFTLDYLKIDRGFVNAIGRETITSPVLDAVLTLTHRLNLVTVAEGVETEEQAAWLRDHGVDYLQGYLISRPLTLQQLIEEYRKPAKYFTS
ncbi:cyclic di-GMP phosphodiesterase [Kluyvera ascorbata]|uniref:cyclic di-GMP phosphodiesterase n=1 Tax=Kluyvera ascorbata TaxID=51288 RepID=UPI001A1CA633|nr:cyclic di-GMP phosphodiesterase [Kluyvera ascorbata]MDU3912922.1 cyclic di-GMP phosphodiesterase [Kluyvera ascorbata]HAT7515748.1 cyclic di-GMP phosphodiesterase [Kluyvera ascorbata]HDG1665065.1 cyclic di-GMP phosphodiesterase [Kluyvera ascorbata]HDG1676229.1 cyclic di-GMP phosphodiesterase [Kluyvera ascorbata]HDG1703281.1 cyclic di-GMP phosphodiesterase [Kluyvera ascorbata]